MQMPRVICDRCGREIAAAPVAGRLGAGRVWRHDEPDGRHQYGGALVSCPGSLNTVDLPAADARQLQIVAPAPPAGAEPGRLLALF